MPDSIPWARLNAPLAARFVATGWATAPGEALGRAYVALWTVQPEAEVTP